MKSTGQARFRSTINFKLRKEDMETTTKEVVTVPDDSYTVKELLERHQAGIPISLKVPEYDLQDEDSEDHEAIDMEQFQKLEPTEQQEIADIHAETLKKHREKLNKEEAERKKKESEKAENDRKKAIIEEHEKSKKEVKKE